MPFSSPSAGRRALLGVDLTAAGARPGAVGAHGAVAARAFDGERLARLVHRADRGLLDLVVLGDALLLHPGRRQVPGRLDAAVAAARVAPLVRTAALVAGVPHDQVEPGHLAGGVRGVQNAAGGAAGWQLSGPGATGGRADLAEPGALGAGSASRVAAPAGSAAAAVAAAGAAAADVAGGAPADAAAAAAAERRWADRAAAALDAVLAAWAAGEPGAVRRGGDGRFRVDHDGIRFAVRGRSAARSTARGGDGDGTAPAERPLVVVPVAGPAAEALAGRYADVARLTAPDLEAAAAARSRVRAAAVAAGRPADAVRVLLDVDVALADDRESALARLDLVRSVDRPDIGVAGAVVAGTGADLATVLADAVRDGAVDGFVALPTSVEADLAALVERTVPALQQAGAFRLRPGDGDEPGDREPAVVRRRASAARGDGRADGRTDARADRLALAEGPWSAAPFALT
ncbi:LLM class flavin-dependent oxidoreductase [Cellulomonas sp. GbtcB1]|uniref:LLM class flavin-dependent oxidoreductase n=1 Tax=Cellulomonas sp. GbtcB1 TaxID=2824746 RepID=UPI001C308301|nr:LLM class flavin-dependent oxidoreductase [Cellulomonas sp. GbtcB1]